MIPGAVGNIRARATPRVGPPENRGPPGLPRQEGGNPGISTFKPSKSRLDFTPRGNLAPPWELPVRVNGGRMEVNDD